MNKAVKNMDKARVNFTKRTLETLPLPDGDRYIIYRDSTTRGLGLKIEPTGQRTFFWSRKALGRAQWKTIGEFPHTSLDAARAQANSFNIDREKWRATGENPFAQPSAVTVGKIIEEYVERHIRLATARPDRAVKDVEGQRDRCLKHFVDRKIASIRRAEILALREEIRKKRGPCAANRLIHMIAASINWAIKAELWDGENPAKNIAKFTEHPRQRFLQKHELDALRVTLDRTENRDLRDFVRLSLMTGARKSDVTSIRWTDLALDAATWLVAQPKNQIPYRIGLTREAVQILRERQAITGESEWVFPSTSKSGHVLDFKRSWGQLLKRAGLEDVHQHDLRRTLGSWQAARGESLLVIGKSLGHKSTRATEIYSQLDLGPVRESVERATAAMFAKTPKPKLLPKKIKARKAG